MQRIGPIGHQVWIAFMNLVYCIWFAFIPRWIAFTPWWILFGCISCLREHDRDQGIVIGGHGGGALGGRRGHGGHWGGRGGKQRATNFRTLCPGCLVMRRIVCGRQFWLYHECDNIFSSSAILPLLIGREWTDNLPNTIKGVMEAFINFSKIGRYP